MPQALLLKVVYDIRFIGEGQFKAPDPLDQLVQESERATHRSAIPMWQETLPQHKETGVPGGKSAEGMGAFSVADAIQRCQGARSGLCLQAGSPPTSAADENFARHLSEDESLVAEDARASCGKPVGQG